MKTLLLTAVLAIAPTLAMASELCDMSGEFAHMVAEVRDKGVSLKKAITVLLEDDDAPAAWIVYTVNRVYSFPRYSPDTERRMTIAACEKQAKESK